MTPYQIIEIIGILFGFTYLYLEYKASFWLWIAGVAMSLFYVIVYGHAGFYALMLTNVYYIGANLYGLWMWKKSKDMQTADSSDVIKPLPQKLIIPLIGVYIILNLIVYYALTFTDSTVPLEDAFLTSLGMVAMWMMAKKYYHQWLIWIVVNIASVFIFFRNGLPPTAILYIFYTIVSIMGYFNWRKMAR